MFIIKLKSGPKKGERLKNGCNFQNLLFFEHLFCCVLFWYIWWLLFKKSTSKKIPFFLNESNLNNKLSKFTSFLLMKYCRFSNFNTIVHNLFVLWDIWLDCCNIVMISSSSISEFVNFDPYIFHMHFCQNCLSTNS